MAEEHEDIPVLIVGAGPAGLMTAVELTRRGVPVRIIEKLEESSPYSKALGVWPRTFELFRRIDPTKRMEVLGQYQAGIRYYTDGRELVTLPYTDHARATVLPQPEVEGFLEAELKSRDVLVERGKELKSTYTNDNGDIVAIVNDVGNPQQQESISCHYLVGADGASSLVRKERGIEFTGDTYPATFVVADAHIEGNLDPALTHYFCSTQGVMVVSALPNGEYRFFTSALPNQDPDTMDLAALQQIVDSRAFTTRIKLRDYSWISAFRVHARQASRIRDGRVFLVGDAAHIHSPAGGQGLNTGVADAHNLAWKMAAVYHEKAVERLLDTYALERRPVATDVVKSADQQTKLWVLSGRYKIALRNALLKIAAHTPYFSHVYFPRLAGVRFRYASMRTRQGRDGKYVGELIRNCDVFDVRSGKMTSLRLALPDDRYTILIDGAVRRGELLGVLSGARVLGLEVRTLLRSESRLEVGPRFLSHAARGLPKKNRVYLVRPDGYVAYFGDDIGVKTLREITYAAPQKGESVY